MAVTFKDLMQAELQGKVKKNSQMATLITAVKDKAYNLQATIEMRGSDFLTEDTVAAAERAADQMVESLIDDMLADISNDGTRTTGIKVDKIPGLRTKRGTYIGTDTLARILQISLQRYIKELSGTDGRLNYVTGRLAASANIESITESETSEGKVSLMFTYMLAPYYHAFEPGGHMYKEGRSPSDHIDGAITQALDELLAPESASRFINRFGRTET